MRTFLTIILTSVLFYTTTAQDNVNEKEMVGFGCYYEGRSTKTVVKVTKLLQRNKYNDISKLLTSDNNGEKYLAVISLQRLAALGQYTLTDGEKDLIGKARLSDDKVSVCSGCTYFDEVAMKTILSDDKLIGSTYWLNGVIKEDKKNAP